MQFAVFQPLFRPHAQEHIAAEPVFHDTHTKALAKEAIELRYSLMPYNYALAFENSQMGCHLCGHSFLSNRKIKMLVYDKSYLWGNDLLVSPVVDSAAVSQSVYFPEGSNWFDFYDHGKYAGGSNSEVELVEEHIPVFARGGALIPMIDPVMSSDQYSTEKVRTAILF
ncbi:MAG: glycoside hydrolase family 31 protein [Bacteroidales bacterium]